MRELKSYTSPYDIKRAPAFFGPYRRTSAHLADLVIAVLFLAFIVGIFLGVL